MAAIARALETAQAPQGLGQDELVGGSSDLRDRILLGDRLLPETDGALPAARGVLVLTLRLAAPGGEQRPPAGRGQPALGLRVAAEPGVDRGVPVSGRDFHAWNRSAPNVPSDTAANFLR